MSDGLKAQHRAAIIAALAANDRVERAVLFGSRAMGTNTITSDVDIALFGDRLTLTDQAHLATTCGDLPMAQSVDLVLHNTIDKPALVDHIRTRGVEWYRRGGVAAAKPVLQPSPNEDNTSLYHPSFPNHWTYESLYSMAHWVNGLAFKNIRFTSSGKPVIKISEIKNGISSQTKFTQSEFDESVRVYSGDLLFAWSGQPETSIDAFWWRGPEGWLNQHIFRVTSSDKIDQTFFFYLLRYLRPNFIAIARNKQTTGLGHVTKQDLQRIVAASPSLPEQKAIAHILGTLDDKIELNRRMNETLEAMAQAIFKDWFVDFGPVWAKAEGREAYLPEDVWGLFPDSFQESELGEIPRGWGVCSIGSLLTLERKSLIPGDTPQETFSHYSIPAFDNEMLPAQEMGGNIKSSKYIVSKGTFLVSKLNPKTSRVWLPSASKILKQICSTEFLVCRPSFSVGVPFSYLLAKSNSVVQRMGDLASGTSNSHQRIQLADFISLPIIRCNEKLLTFFNASISPLLQKSLETRKENSLLKKCRDILLPKLLSGEIRIQDIGFLIKGERS